MTTAREALNRTLLLTRDLVPDEVTDDTIVGHLRGTRVTVVADAPNLGTVGGQSAVVTLVTQALALGADVDLAFPDVGILGNQLPLRGCRLAEALTQFSSDFMPDPRARSVSTIAENSAVFFIGSTPAAAPSSTSWRVVGTAGGGSLLPASEPGQPFPDYPLGALAAANLAAAEVFKLAVRPLVDVRLADLVAPSARAMVRILDDAIATAPRALGRVDCISGGAVIQAFAHVLLRVPEISGDLHVIEPDSFDLTNLNRYPLMRFSQVGRLKTEGLEACSTTSLRIRGTPAAFTSATMGDLAPLAENVAVGTDQIPPRWLVQDQEPAWLGIGATTHFQALVSDHTMDTACVRCLHPDDDGVRAAIPTVGFVSYWAGLLLAAKLLAHVSGRANSLGCATLLGSLRPDGPRARLDYEVRRSASCSRCMRAA